MRAQAQGSNSVGELAESNGSLRRPCWHGFWLSHLGFRGGWGLRRVGSVDRLVQTGRVRASRLRQRQVEAGFVGASGVRGLRLPDEPRRVARGAGRDAELVVHVRVELGRLLLGLESLVAGAEQVGGGRLRVLRVGRRVERAAKGCVVTGRRRLGPQLLAGGLEGRGAAQMLAGRAGEAGNGRGRQLGRRAQVEVAEDDTGRLGRSLAAAQADAQVDGERAQPTAGGRVRGARRTGSGRGRLGREPRRESVQPVA